MAKAKLKEVPQPVITRLDFGCGKTPREGFEGIDSRDFGQKHKLDVVARKRGVKDYEVSGKPRSDGYDVFEKWPWEDGSIEEGHASHFVEHLNRWERVFFVNELYRVLRTGGKCLIVTPNWSSCRAYGDMTHEWSPVSEFWFNYLNKPWREANAPHNDFYTCDFDSTGGWSLHPGIVNRNIEYQQHALTYWKEAGPDLITTVQKNR